MTQNYATIEVAEEVPRIALVPPGIVNNRAPLLALNHVSAEPLRDLSMAQYVFTMSRVGKVVPPNRIILKDISLSFFPGAKIGVLGLNGSGKSSLLRIMAGLDQEHLGEARPQPELRIGYLPQEPELDSSKDVLGMLRTASAKSKI